MRHTGVVGGFAVRDHLSDKIIRDPVHGYIRLDDACLEVVDTAQFQRLRDLKQLGTIYLVFPGGSHNRFEHSIGKLIIIHALAGVSHLAGQMVETFQQKQPELELNESDIRCVKIAGLCHDLGHGPFSHVFDNEFIPQARPGYNWSHEQGSEMMLDYLVEENNLDLEQEDVRFIKDLIRGEPHYSAARDGKRFLFDIVANQRNSVDVDKFDYIARDCYNLGELTGYDCSRLMQSSRVLNDQICYYHKEVYNLYELFNTRYSLFKRVYSHSVGKALDLMITDAMLAADPYLHFSSAIDSGEDYMRLTDHIIKEIELSKAEAGVELAESRRIIKRIRQRQLYRFVEERMIPVEYKAYLNKERINAREICAHQSEDAKICEQDVIVKWLTMGYGFKGKNPVDRIMFYSKFKHEPFHIPREQVSALAPERFDETLVRVYSRDPTKVKVIQEAFGRLMDNFGQLRSATSPNPGHQLPDSWESPRKRRYSSAEDSDSMQN
ncbi:HD phosphohydrolase domain-containing protein [Thamnocephalis sphaerospora]|uniref:HD phosphohydrolase domain-containing protein n=1 Tax=Thamnocephalis sphaerospora TaxID=78915 RepID=A0A4P9XTU7_9FUNG|nr:HD phosphohydrolase domain-containing protein [Thamnocephalis sphaerospora]|eukprot:RKP09607.1 HD phosphohydrolase domain-containing protein [Thamnocephalis sphaerospora]